MNKQLRRTIPKLTKSQVNDMLSKIKTGDKIRVNYGERSIQSFQFRGFVDSLPIVRSGRYFYEVWNMQYLHDMFCGATLKVILPKNQDKAGWNATWSWSWQ